MKAYDVKCLGCYKEFEAILTDDKWVTPCPKCHNTNLEIVFKKAPCFRLRGTGFHKTDYDEHGPYDRGHKK